MVRRTRVEMEETRASLLATARTVFSERGYADTSMDDLTAQAGLTRGALYHHFGDKKGLLLAVVEQIDAEMDGRLQSISDSAGDLWEGFRHRCRAYLEMALEPEIQRIVLRDARAVLGGASPDSQRHCLESMQGLIRELIHQGIVADTCPEALASMIYGSLAEAAFWIADGDEGNARLIKGVAALDLLLRGLLLKR
ncbi:transposon Tn10 TetC protein [Janthinobacterium sp. HH103]|uniref:TetR/AcrR family transcriptional regulator n=1 Tax=Janthinobacterium agaricidamnosum TaxID=55508 RepID=A0A3G2EAY8_9BURK|nr:MULTISPECIES: TetR/AcrR family transcriptional regulator [Janthinobacterium]AYM77123.1 TetR/AcrR family transcriptional regulator [Janthinobacterium agaricidamnosum]OEZ69890.1 transposon Tn10 TetC protein [Janthinobacterium sp. HH100]OEZ71287.1 transposon Tn10 TetC protein [Janthinobacterium sp. HH103]PHV36384.1 TetR/AcrR family transcriptional regulator [Janthinobacterium sp. BJB304]QOU74248.1 Transposon Tn10 TetC protein [Janthinobacterium sp. HH102]